MMMTPRDIDGAATGLTVAHRMRAIMIKLGNCGTKLGQRFRSNSRTNPDRSHRRFGLGRVSRLTFRHSFCQSRLATLRAVQAGRLITQSEEEGASGAGAPAGGVVLPSNVSPERHLYTCSGLQAAMAEISRTSDSNLVDQRV